MTYRVALNFEDGATRFIECNEGEKVLDAAYRNKINLPMDCSDGVCGTCKCRCEQGEYDLGDEYLEDALSEAEADEGMVLTCQMVPSSDCVIAVPVPSTACKLKPAELGGEVSSVELVSDSTIILKLKLDKPEALGFLPGQYVNLTVPGTSEHRSYSFSSKVGATEASFLIRNVPGGLMSGWLANDAKTGHADEVRRSAGKFLPARGRSSGRDARRRHRSGTHPVDARSPRRPRHRSAGASDLRRHQRRRSGGDRADRSTRQALADLTWATCVANPDSVHPLKGYVTAHLADEHLNAGDCDVYLCGPPPMVEAVRVFFTEKGLNPLRFFYEKFSATEAVTA